MAFPKKKNRTRPPVSGRLRRLPGQSVREELNRIMDDDVSGYVFVIVAVWLLVFWEFARGWLPAAVHLSVLIIAASGTTAYCVFRMFRLRKDVRNLVQADKAERRVSELLRQLRGKDYVTFDDLVDEDASSKSNIDHVVVGPGGVYAVETKGFSVFGDRCAEIDGEGVLRLGRKSAIKNPLGQAKASAAKVAEHLRSCLQQKYWVQPVLVLPGWKVLPAKADVGVAVLNNDTISDYFVSRPRLLSNEEIRQICSHLDRSARS
jgi:hypothetical protein